MLQPITTLHDLDDLLCSLTVGQFYVLPYTTYARLFPPGEPSPGARIRAYDFARNNRCAIHIRSSTEHVVFTKQ
jgi:hypothetical protein